MPDDMRMRWCRVCSAEHPGAVELKNRKMCEACGLKRPTHGFQTAAEAATGIPMPPPPGDLVAASAGTEEFAGLRKGKAARWRWCAGCAKDHEGAKYLGNRKMCENHDTKRANWGMKSDHVTRWCAVCAKLHGAQSPPLLSVPV